MPLKPALSSPSAVSPGPEAAFGLQLACFPSMSPRDFSLIQQILSTCPGPAGDTAVTSASPTQGSQWQGQAHSQRAAPGVDKTGIGRVVHGVAEGFRRGRVAELGAEVLGGVKRVRVVRTAQPAVWLVASGVSGEALHTTVHPQALWTATGSWAPRWRRSSRRCP